MRRFVRLVCGGCIALTVAASVGAQAPEVRPAPGAPARGDRAEMEQRLRERFAEVVRDRLDLTDEQARRLRESNQRFEQRRRELLREEIGTRAALRDQLRQANPDERRVGELLERMLTLQRQRIELLGQEQRALSEFLTPVQRARYLALQEQFRQRVQGAREARGRGPRRGIPPR